MFWERGVLGLDNPRSLLYTTFFYVGLHFCLRGGQEQRDYFLLEDDEVLISFNVVSLFTNVPLILFCWWLETD